MSDQDGVDFASEDGNKVNYLVLFAIALFAYARAVYTYVSQGHGFTAVDGTWAELRGNSQGRPVGGYLILGWDKDGPSPEDQANKFISTYGSRRKGELLPALDLEANSYSSLGCTPEQCLAWALRAYDVLVARYGVVAVYTSRRVYAEVFGNLPSRMDKSHGWIKVGYWEEARKPVNRNSCPPMEDRLIPPPWLALGSPGARIAQYQGDATGHPGVSSTVDTNRFIPLRRGDRGNGVAWLQGVVGADVDDDFGPHTEAALATWQLSVGLPETGEMDLATYVAILDALGLEVVA